MKQVRRYIEVTSFNVCFRLSMPNVVTGFAKETKNATVEHPRQVKVAIQI